MIADHAFINARDGAQAVVTACNVLLSAPQQESRAGATREALNATLVLPDPYRMTPVGIERHDLRVALGLAEGLHLVSGQPPGELIRLLTADIDTVRWASEEEPAGMVARDQLLPMIAELEARPDSRRGNVTLWRPGDLSRADQGCATGLHFMRRGGRLRLTVTMRSNDVWHGLPYNLMAFGLLQATVARHLGVGAGAYTHQVASLHLYEHHEERAAALRWPPSEPVPVIGGLGHWCGSAVDGFTEARARAHTLLLGGLPNRPNMTEEIIARAVYEAVA